MADSAARTFRGVVHGNAIELVDEPKLPEGQQVWVTLEAITDATANAGEGLRRSAGGWSDDRQGLDEYLQWVRRQRKQGRTGLEP